METINLLKEKCDEIIKMNWFRCRKKGNSSAGLLFEELLEIPRNNFEIADYNGVEIKTKISKKEDYISLFCATPDSYLFEIKRIYNTYAYYDKNKQFKSFNISVYANKTIKIGYNKFCKLKIDYDNKKIILLIIDNRGIIIDDKSSWSFDMIKEKLERKFQYLLMVYGDRKFELGEVFYKFNNYIFYRLKTFEHFLKSIENGHTRISFSISTFKTGKRIGQIYDHGTSFNIHKNFLDSIFDEIII